MCLFLIVLNLFKFLPVKIDLNPVLHDVFGYENLCPDVGAIVERNNPVFFKTKKFKWRGTADSNLSILLSDDSLPKITSVKPKPGDFVLPVKAILTG